MISSRRAFAMARYRSAFLKTAGIAVDPVAAAEQIARTATQHALLMVEANEQVTPPFLE
jgi:hypothetical protein